MWKELVNRTYYASIQPIVLAATLLLAEVI
jgi:hypothetical protein